MKIKHLTKYLAIVAVAVAGAFGIASWVGGEDELASAPLPVAPILDEGASGGTVLAGEIVEPAHFVGKPLDVAALWAEELGRQWRVGREDGVDLALTADFVAGRVTFTVEDGMVTAATIEAEDEQSS